MVISFTNFSLLHTSDHDGEVVISPQWDISTWLCSQNLRSVFRNVVCGCPEGNCFGLSPKLGQEDVIANFTDNKQKVLFLLSKVVGS